MCYFFGRNVPRKPCQAGCSTKMVPRSYGCSQQGLRLARKTQAEPPRIHRGKTLHMHSCDANLAALWSGCSARATEKPSYIPNTHCRLPALSSSSTWCPWPHVQTSNCPLPTLHRASSTTSSAPSKTPSTTWHAVVGPSACRRRSRRWREWVSRRHENMVGTSWSVRAVDSAVTTLT